MKGNRLFFVSMICIVLVAAASASETSAGLRFSFSGGPMLSLVIDQRLGPNMRVDFAVGGFPGILLNLEANLRFIPEMQETFYFGGGIGCRRIYRGRGAGETLKELHSVVGYHYETNHAFFSGQVGVLYAPQSINAWTSALSDNPGIIIMAPFANIEALRQLK